MPHRVVACGSRNRLHGVPEQRNHDVIGDQLSCGDVFVDRGSGWASSLKFGTEKIARREVTPAELRLGEFAHRPFPGPWTSENENYVGAGTGQPRVVVVEHDLRGRSDSLLVDMPLAISRRQVVVAGDVIGEMTVETADSPGVVAVRIRDRRAAGRCGPARR